MASTTAKRKPVLADDEKSQGIPEGELWECRKNALSDQVRAYLDTGVLPEVGTAKPPRHEELLGEAADTRPTRREAATAGAGGSEAVPTGGAAPTEGTRHTHDLRMEGPEISIASLYGHWGDSGGDY